MEEDQAVHAERELDKFTLSITREDKRALKSYACLLYTSYKLLNAFRR